MFLRGKSHLVIGGCVQTQFNVSKFLSFYLIFKFAILSPVILLLLLLLFQRGLLSLDGHIIYQLDG